MKTKPLLTMLALLGTLLGTGCRSIDPHRYPQMPSRKNREAYTEVQAKMDGKPHGIWIPANTNVVIKPWQKLNPLWEIFGNADDPKPPIWYRPNECEFVRKLLWKFRNPLHNFDFYGAGLADKDIVLIGKYPELIGKPGGGWNFTIVAYKRLRLPFVSYTHGGFNFYFGWRNHGNFGIKLNYSRKKKEKDVESPPAKPRQMSGRFYLNKKAVQGGPSGDSFSSIFNSKA